MDVRNTRAGNRDIAKRVIHMTENYDALLSSPGYAFLASNPHLGSNVDSLFLGGSKAYGLSTPDSDTDIRGFATRSAEDILLGRDFGTVVDKTTDTTIYSFDKFVHLLAGANPNIVEFLGLRGDAYIRVGTAGRLLLDNADAFLSKRAGATFGGYAMSQLNRIENAMTRGGEDNETRCRHMARSINHAVMSFEGKFSESFDKASFDASAGFDPENDTEIGLLIDVEGKKVPIKEFAAMSAELTQIVREYDKLTARNRKRDAKHLAKHMSHLIRLYHMGTEILRGDGVITDRRDAGDADMLMEIKNGRYMLPDGTVDKSFFGIVEEESASFDEAMKSTKLPDKPDMARIESIIVEVNGGIVSESR